MIQVTHTIDDAVAELGGEEQVMVHVPKRYFLRLSHKHTVEVPAGTQYMPKLIAEHPYSVANGVTMAKPAVKPRPQGTKSTKNPEPVDPNAKPIVEGHKVDCGCPRCKAGRKKLDTGEIADKLDKATGGEGLAE